MHNTDIPWSGTRTLSQFLADRDLSDASTDWISILTKRLAGIPIDTLEREAFDSASRELVHILSVLESERDHHFMRASEATSFYCLCSGQIKQDVLRRKISPREIIRLGRENLISKVALERLYGHKEEYYG